MRSNVPISPANKTTRGLSSTTSHVQSVARGGQSELVVFPQEVSSQPGGRSLPRLFGNKAPAGSPER